MKIAILEDEQIHTKALGKFLAEHYGNTLKITEYAYGKPLIDCYVNGSADFDILFLDIILDGASGVVTAQAIRELGSDVPIVFVTNANAYAEEIFDVDALGYISKPIELQKLKNVLIKADKMRTAKTMPTLCVKTESGAVYRLTLSEVTYITKDDRYTVFHRLSADSIQSSQSIAEFEGTISAQSMFVSVYRSDYVNLLHIRKINKHKRIIELTNGKIVNISRPRLSAVMDAFTNLFEEI